MSDAYATIKLAAKHNKLILVRNQQLAAGNSNSVFMEFDLRTDDWVGCNKLRAVFNDYYTRSLDKCLRCDIPAEVLAIPGEFSVNLYGIDGNIRLSTNKVKFLVGEGCCGGIFPGDGGTSSGCGGDCCFDRDDIFNFDGGDADGDFTDNETIVVYDGGGVYGF